MDCKLWVLSIYFQNQLSKFLTNNFNIKRGNFDYHHWGHTTIEGLSSLIIYIAKINEESRLNCCTTCGCNLSCWLDKLAKKRLNEKN